MAVAAYDDGRVRPVHTDAPDQTAHMATHFFSRRCLAWLQNHHHRAARGHVIDMDRLEAALVFVGVEQRELLMAMNHIDRVVEIEDHRLGRGFVALAINIRQTSAKLDQIFERGRVFEPGDRRLRTKVKACFRQAAAS